MIVTFSGVGINPHNTLTRGIQLAKIGYAFTVRQIRYTESIIRTSAGKVNRRLFRVFRVSFHPPGSEVECNNSDQTQ